MIVWSTAAIYFSNLPSDALRKIAAIAYVVALIVVFIRVRPMWKARLTIVSGFIIVLAWFFLIPASNERDWQPDAAKIPFAEINGDRVAVHNIRNCDYQTETNFTVAYYDKTVDLSKLRSVDLFLCDWGTPMIAHTMLSFGFEGGDYICISIEARKEKGESYSALRSFFRKFELIYVFGDERDLVRLRSNYRGENVYLYRLNTELAVSRLVFMSYIKQINRLKERPEWYNAVTANCTTMIRGHTKPYVKNAHFDWRMLINGSIDRMAYERGTLDQSLPFEQLKARSLINEKAKAADKDPAFSKRIRE
jgi:hypothetical protein